MVLTDDCSGRRTPSTTASVAVGSACSRPPRQVMTCRVGAMMVRANSGWSSIAEATERGRGRMRG
jgi:hypothetical protein